MEKTEKKDTAGYTGRKIHIDMILTQDSKH